jgi:hypothetical protein
MTKHVVKVALGAVLALLVSVAGCGSGTATTAPGPGDSVLTPAVESVTLQSLSGGFHNYAPAGAACEPTRWTYAIALAAHHVTWTGCTVNGTSDDPASYVPTTTEHAVDSAHWPAVATAVADVTVSDGTGCGADKDQWVFAVQSPSDTVTYGEDFYACNTQYPRYVTTTSLESLYTTLNALP